MPGRLDERTVAISPCLLQGRAASTRLFPVHLVTSSSHCFRCPPCLLFPGTVPIMVSFSRLLCLVVCPKYFNLRDSHGQLSVLPHSSQNLIVRHVFRVWNPHGPSATLHLKYLNVLTEAPYSVSKTPSLWAVYTCDYRPNQGLYESSFQTPADRAWLPYRR